MNNHLSDLANIWLQRHHTEAREPISVQLCRNYEAWADEEPHGLDPVKTWNYCYTPYVSQIKMAWSSVPRALCDI